MNSKPAGLIALKLALWVVALAFVAACGPKPDADGSGAGQPTQSRPVEPVKVRLSIDDEAMIPNLAMGLGYFADEGIEIQEVDIAEVADPEYRFQEALISGDLDFSYHWFQHAVFGARHGLPVAAVMVASDSPGMTVLVANRVKDEIRSGADFGGRRVAEGARYATKAMLMNYLAKKGGGEEGNYTSVAQGTAGRREAVVEGFKAGQIDLAAFMEPMTSVLLDTNLVTPLFDLTSRSATVRTLGAGLPSEALLVSHRYIEENPDVVQRMVNAFVRTMRYVNSHSAEEIVANLPEEYMQGRDVAAQTELVRKTLKVYAQDNYAVIHEDAELMIDVIDSFSFDESDPGRWRAVSEVGAIDPSGLYVNRFVESAMESH